MGIRILLPYLLVLVPADLLLERVNVNMIAVLHIVPKESIYRNIEFLCIVSNATFLVLIRTNTWTNSSVSAYSVPNVEMAIRTKHRTRADDVLCKTEY